MRITFPLFVTVTPLTLLCNTSMLIPFDTRGATDAGQTPKGCWCSGVRTRSPKGQDICKHTVYFVSFRRTCSMISLLVSSSLCTKDTSIFSLVNLKMSREFFYLLVVAVLFLASIILEKIAKSKEIPAMFDFLPPVTRTGYLDSDTRYFLCV